MPPELNTARLLAAARVPLNTCAAAGWQFQRPPDAQAVELTRAWAFSGRSLDWGGDRRAAATPMVVWQLQTASTQAKTRAMQARRRKPRRYTRATATTPSLPEVAANSIAGRTAITSSVSTYDPDRALTEMDVIRMWNQAALTMEVYQAETAVNTLSSSSRWRRSLIRHEST